MKNKIVLLLTASILLSFTGCSEKTPSETGEPIIFESYSESADTSADDDQPAEAEENIPKESDEQTDKSDAPDYLSLYAPVLDETCGIIYNGFNDDDSFRYASSGVTDMANMVEKDELTCEDFYFTDTEGDNFDVIIPYHNTTGQWDAKASEKANISEEELWKLCDEMRAGCIKMEMTPLKSYPFS